MRLNRGDGFMLGETPNPGLGVHAKLTKDQFMDEAASG